MYLFLSLYNILPYISYHLFGGRIFFADEGYDSKKMLDVFGNTKIEYVDYAFEVFVTGLVAYVCGCLFIRSITQSIPYSNSPPLEFKNLKLISYLTFGLILAGVILTGQINYIGFYGGGDPAHASFSTLLHFTLVFNIIFSIFIYSRFYGIENKHIKYLSLIFLALFIVIGNRSVIMGIIFSSAWFLSTRRKNLTRDLPIIVSLFIFLVLVQTFRGVGHITGDWIDGLIYTFQKFAEKDLWIYLMSIQSDNFGVLSSIISKMETVNYFYGYTYLESLVRLIPGFLRNLIGFNDEGEIFNHLEFLGNPNLAFNLMGEIYMNFSHLGVILLMFVIGLCVGYLSDLADKKKSIYIIFMLNMYPTILTLARNDSALWIKQLIYTVVILFIILAVSLKKKTSRDEYENRR